MTEQPVPSLNQMAAAYVATVESRLQQMREEIGVFQQNIDAMEEHLHECQEQLRLNEQKTVVPVSVPVSVSLPNHPSASEGAAITSVDLGNPFDKLVGK